MTDLLRPHRLRLGVNIDHVATIRNARGGDHPDPVRAAQIVEASGGDGITAHLREDRRHIRDDDLARIQAATDLPLNLEMAATEEMLAIALRHRHPALRLGDQQIRAEGDILIIERQQGDDRVTLRANLSNTAAAGLQPWQVEINEG